MLNFVKFYMDSLIILLFIIKFNFIHRVDYFVIVDFPSKVTKYLSRNSTVNKKLSMYKFLFSFLENEKTKLRLLRSVKNFLGILFLKSV